MHSPDSWIFVEFIIDLFSDTLFCSSDIINGFISVANLSSIFNSAINFLIYMLKGKKFRAQFRQTFGGFWSCLKLNGPHLKGGQEVTTVQRMKINRATSVDVTTVARIPQVTSPLSQGPTSTGIISVQSSMKTYCSTQIENVTKDKLKARLSAQFVWYENAVQFCLVWKSMAPNQM